MMVKYFDYWVKEVILRGWNPCRRLASQTLSMLDMVLPHSFSFHPSKPCTIPATRQALITLLGNQFCHLLYVSQKTINLLYIYIFIITHNKIHKVIKLISTWYNVILPHRSAHSQEKWELTWQGCSGRRNLCAIS